MIKTEDQLVDDFLDPESPSGEGKEVKRRNRLNPRQVTRLMEVFEQTAKPKADIRHKLAEELGMHPRAVQIWFQNRRQKLKKESLEATAAESKYPLDKAKLTLCDTNPVYTTPQTSYLSGYGLTLNSFPSMAKGSIADAATFGLQTPSSIAILSGLGLGPSQDSILSSSAALSLSPDFSEAATSLDNQINNSSLALLQGCNTVSLDQDDAFPNLFDGGSLALDVASHSRTSSATSSNTNCTDPTMDSSINGHSPFLSAGLDSLGLDLSSQISMLQRQHSYPQNLPMKRKAFSWHDLYPLMPPGQEKMTNPSLADHPAKSQNLKRQTPEVIYGNQHPIMSTSPNRNPSLPVYTRSFSDPFVGEMHPDGKRRRVGESISENEDILSAFLPLEQELNKPNSAGGLSDMLAYL